MMNLRRRIVDLDVATNVSLADKGNLAWILDAAQHLQGARTLGLRLQSQPQQSIGCSHVLPHRIVGKIGQAAKDTVQRSGLRRQQVAGAIHVSILQALKRITDNFGGFTNSVGVTTGTVCPGYHGVAVFR